LAKRPAKPTRDNTNPDLLSGCRKESTPSGTLPDDDLTETVRRAVRNELSDLLLVDDLSRKVETAVLDRFAPWWKFTRLLLLLLSVIFSMVVLIGLMFGVGSHKDVQDKLVIATERVASLQRMAEDYQKQLQEGKRQVAKIISEAKDLHSETKALRDEARTAQNQLHEMKVVREHLQKLTQRIEFVENGYMSVEMKRYVTETIQSYRDYLLPLGIVPETSVITVEVDASNDAIPCYDPNANRLDLSPGCVKDVDLVRRFYTISLLNKYADFGAIRSGLAFYFPCAARNDPQFAQTYAVLPNVTRSNRLNPRNLRYQRRFSDLPKDAMPEDYGEIWAGALWEIRGLLGAEKADPLVAETVRNFSPHGYGPAEEQRFVYELIQGARKLDEGKWVQEIHQILERRGWNLRSP
jgi:hypothetical protein